MVCNIINHSIHWICSYANILYDTRAIPRIGRLCVINIRISRFCDVKIRNVPLEECCECIYGESIVIYRYKKMKHDKEETNER